MFYVAINQHLVAVTKGPWKRQNVMDLDLQFEPLNMAFHQPVGQNLFVS